MKKSWFKRVLSVVLVTAMVIGGISFVPAEANAEETFPEHFDLRTWGVVTPVKFQNPWQCCWAFSGIAAAETSILTMLGMSNEEFKDVYGSDFDLSERHLAWFAEYPITALTNPTQVGEGVHTFGAEENPQKVYDNGGFNVMVSTLFSSGVGPVFESYFPYNGSSKLTCLQYAKMYPDKAMPSIIKFEEESLFEKSYDEAYTELTSQNWAFDDVTPAWIKKLKDNGCLDGYNDTTTITKEQFQDICYNYYIVYQTNGIGDSFYTNLDDWTIPDANEQGIVNRDVYSGYTLLDGNKLPEIAVKDANHKYQSTSWEAINAVKSELTKGHGVSIGFSSDSSKPGDVETGKYLNLKTWAHYTYEDAQPTHAVCIVGWDDNYSAENFNEGHRPPGDGAFIVKNSWGSETDWYDNGTGGTIGKHEWGVENDEGEHTGYFYLSYYDKGIFNPETVTFDTDLYNVGGNISVEAYDYMPSLVSTQEDTTVHTTEVVKTANVFKNHSDNPQKLYSVSTKTSAPEATVEYSIYRVNDNFQNPEEGTLLGKVTGTYQYEGFHREKLDGSIVIMPGEYISIVTEESAIIDGEKKYGFNVNSGIDEEGSQGDAPSYSVAVVNPGESFYYSGGKWTDWTKVIPDVKASIKDGQYYVIDNFSIKAYTVSTTSAMYRLYNPNSGEHFYTASATEKDNLVGQGWTYEDIAWTAPVSSDTPVYRLYSEATGDHHYTTNEGERDYLIEVGWKSEVIGWYSADNGLPIYRVFNPNATGAGSHHYTADVNEKNNLIDQGWIDEGVGWYGMT